jgi:sialic acid synthase SpsE
MDIIKEENYKSIFLMKTDTKFPVKFLEIEFNSMLKRSSTIMEWFYSKDARMV